jgi:hypothetical protein
MTRADVEAYLARDWAAVARLKTDHWGRAGAAAALCAADILREHARAMCPEWPTSRDREEDIQTHTKVARILSRTPALRR